MKTILLAMVLLIAGCTQNQAQEGLTVKTVSIQSESVDELKSLLPHWKELQIEECKFVKRNELHDSELPSPSDTKLQLIGCVKLSTSSAKEIAALGDWASVDVADIPRSLQDSLKTEPSPFRVSKSFNRMFNRNARYAYGYVVLPSSGGDRLLFIAADLDHPIE